MILFSEICLGESKRERLEGVFFSSLSVFKSGERGFFLFSVFGKEFCKGFLSFRFFWRLLERE